ncbi:NUMOD4 domain-containing protein [Staphylococcus aureus]|uniref:NUMOD4 domain-containing protein n=1 Tax=Staphylococcus aureus TaxID=1280 RepID=UPI001E3982EB|nr:NUMOD4 domain-containing protein [Staphylococcus aureus]UFA53830.1 hypothetical protein LB316_01470 [Staphylococcus aureus]
MKEIWKDVVGYEGIYEVSNKGRVRRLEYRSFRRDGSSRVLKQKILKGKGKKDLTKECLYGRVIIHTIIMFIVW